MEPATFSLAIVNDPTPDRWSRLQAELDAQGAPPIAFEQEDAHVAFRCLTGAFMLRARVYYALEAVWGHGESRRIFRAETTERADEPA